MIARQLGDEEYFFRRWAGDVSGADASCKTQAGDTGDQAKYKNTKLDAMGQLAQHPPVDTRRERGSRGGVASAMETYKEGVVQINAAKGDGDEAEEDETQTSVIAVRKALAAALVQQGANSEAEAWSLISAQPWFPSLDDRERSDLLRTVREAFANKRREAEDARSAMSGLEAAARSYHDTKAAEFRTSLIRILSQHPDRRFILAVDDIGQRSAMMPIYTALDKIRALKYENGKPVFPNLSIIRGSGPGLASKILDESRTKGVETGNIFLVAKKANLDNNVFDAIGGAWITAIDDSAYGDRVYMPVFEAATLTMMAALGEQDAALKFYNQIANSPITPDALEEMLKNRVILLVPKAARVDTERELRAIYELAHIVYTAA